MDRDRRGLLLVPSLQQPRCRSTAVALAGPVEAGTASQGNKSRAQSCDISRSTS
jgi:hypothetical protein